MREQDVCSSDNPLFQVRTRVHVKGNISASTQRETHQEGRKKKKGKDDWTKEKHLSNMKKKKVGIFGKKTSRKKMQGK